MDEIPWYVAHTRPRCEKKLKEYCDRNGFYAVLPTFKSVKKYNRKTVTFEKSVFPNYLFLKLDLSQRQKVFQSDYVANLLDVPNQEEFHEQLAGILISLESDLEVVLAPSITVGSRVKLTSGPLRGLEGYVETRSGTTWVNLRLDFIAQGVAVRVEATDLELT